MKKSVYFLLLSLASAIVMTACGGLFKKEDLKIDVRPEISAEQRHQLKALSSKQLNALNPKEREEVADVLFDYLGKVKWATLMKQVCHITALFQEDKCKTEREACLEKLSDETDAALQSKLKAQEAKLKPQIKQVLEAAKITAEELLIIFDIADSVIKEAAQFDCGVSHRELQTAAEKMAKELEAKHGDKLKQFKEMGEKLPKDLSFNFDISFKFDNSFNFGGF